MHDESQLFFDSDKGGPNINEAFNSLTEDSRVRLEWFGDSNDESICTADYSIRDGRLHKQLFHPLTLSVLIKFKNGDDKCRVYFGAYEKTPWFDDLFEKYKPECKHLLNKEELISLIQRVINDYQKNMISSILFIYNKPILKDYQQFPNDYKKFESFYYQLLDLKENGHSSTPINENHSSAVVPIWIKAVLFVVILKSILFLFVNL
jgi:hypothetical protein